MAEIEKRNLAEAEAKEDAEEGKNTNYSRNYIGVFIYLSLSLRSSSDDDDDDDLQTSTYTPSEFPERVVIIGSGPAGLSAAVYAARAGLRPVVVAPPMGGQLQGKGVDVENYPGLFNVTGPEVVSKMREQAALFGTVFEGDMVTNVNIDKRPFSVELKEVRNEERSDDH